MAAKDEHNFQQSRGGPSFRRGRGRGHHFISNANRILHHLGVRDLREHLDRIRNEQEQVVTGAGRDETILKTVTPDDTESGKQESEPFSSPQNKARSKTFVNRKDRKLQGKDIENPLNIKVEFSTTTGEHIYRVDEKTVLPTIKHVPDQFLDSTNKVFRGRGRGRGRRGMRGRSRGSAPNRYSSRILPETLPPTVQCDENWDGDCNDNLLNASALDLEAPAVEYGDGEYQDAEEYDSNLEDQIKTLNINDSKCEG